MEIKTMSPRKARAKRKGDYVALRGPIDSQHWTHVLLVTATSKASFVACPPNAKATTLRFSFANKAHMGMIRGATAADIRGYETNDA